MSTQGEDSFGERRRALEESFFYEQNQQLLEKMRQQLTTQEKKQALAAASGITDDAVLNHLVAANISAESIAAVSIVPLVFVAWADGSLDNDEKQAILAACEREGIAQNSVCYGLLQQWLSQPPQTSLLTAWKEFVRAARKSLSPEALESLRDDVLGRARNVARASGGILGLASMSQAEQQTLRELEKAFD